jgi:hypothetical protein
MEMYTVEEIFVTSEAGNEKIAIQKVSELVAGSGLP